MVDIEKETLANSDFRRVLYTARSCQLVLMSLKPGQDIGEEVHALDQFFRCEQGTGKAVLDGNEYALENGTVVIVPAGARHNIINTGTDALKVYTLYAPPNHRDGVVHATKEIAEKDEEHFDGVTSENI